MNGLRESFTRAAILSSWEERAEQLPLHVVLQLSPAKLNEIIIITMSILLLLVLF